MDPIKNPQNTALLVSSRKSLAKKIAALMQSAFPDLELCVEESGVDGLNQIYRSPPAVLMVDSALPDISGLQICRVLKHDTPIQKLPVMLITKSGTREYERFTELSLIADTFVEEKKLDEEFTENMNRLLVLYQGLNEAELRHLKLLQQAPVQVQAITRMVQLYDQSITEVSIMEGFRKLFEMSANKNVLHHMLFGMLETTLDYDICGVFFNDKTRDARLVTYHIPHNYVIKDYQLKSWTEKIFGELKELSSEPWAFRDIRYEVITPESHEVGKPLNIKNHQIYPFYIESTLVGALIFLNKKEIRYDLIFPFQLVLNEMSSLMRIRRYYSEAEMLSISDALTGLYTHQHFLWCLGREIRQAKRYLSELALAIISIDNMRQLNSDWGYEVGDQVMKNISHYALQNTRSTDLLARAGGRTIMALFSSTSPKQALVPLERIQSQILKNPVIWDGKPVPVSLSVGVAGLNPKINTASDFIAQAQKAVDQAREKGHNCMELLQH